MIRKIVSRRFYNAKKQNKNKFIQYVLNKIVPTTEPCETLEIMSLKSLLTLLIRTRCLLEVCENVFQAITIIPISIEICNRKLSKNPF